jgi:hypothetical protein
VSGDRGTLVGGHPLEDESYSSPRCQGENRTRCQNEKRAVVPGDRVGPAATDGGSRTAITTISNVNLVSTHHPPLGIHARAMAVPALPRSLLL